MSEQSLTVDTETCSSSCASASVTAVTVVVLCTALWPQQLERWERACPPLGRCHHNCHPVLCPVVSRDDPVEKARILHPPFIARTLDLCLHGEPRSRPRQAHPPRPVHGARMVIFSLLLLLLSSQPQTSSNRKRLMLSSPGRNECHGLLPGLPAECHCTFSPVQP